MKKLLYSKGIKLLIISLMILTMFFVSCLAIDVAVSHCRGAVLGLENGLYLVIIGLFTEMLLFGICCLFAGRKPEDNEIHMLPIDKLYAEVYVLVLALILICALSLCTYAAAMMSSVSYSVDEIEILSGFAVSGLFGGAVALALSLVRNIKNNTFLSRSLVYKLIIKLLYLLRNGVTECRELLKRKSGAVTIAVLAGYTLICGAFGTIGCIVAFAAGCIFLSTRAKELDEIKNGISEIKNGNLSYEIGELKSEDYRAVAADINEIGKGMTKSVEEKLKAERMKTELITNVSHDLKTPLTSIISFTELLEDMELTPEEANDYVKIIAKKADRLKNLTSDLFDISKLQSGNEEIKSELLDAALLVNQSMAEYESEIKKSGLTFIVKADEKVNITADGKKMSRVFSNLINNILKYTAKGTRVFIEVRNDEDNVLIIFKNISSYPLEFDNDEITERFVRGDKSRSEEGSGLGLAIAKGYVEACGGRFRIETDGDMFKAVIIFKSDIHK